MKKVYCSSFNLLIVLLVLTLFENKIYGQTAQYTATSNVQTSVGNNVSLNFFGLPTTVSGSAVIKIVSTGIRTGYMQSYPIYQTQYVICGSYCCRRNWFGSCVETCYNYCPTEVLVGYQYYFVPSPTTIFADNTVIGNASLSYGDCGTASEYSFTISESALKQSVGQDRALRVNFSAPTQNCTPNQIYAVISYNYTLNPVVRPLTNSLIGYGEEVILTGENLGGTSAVTFNGTPASFIINSGTQVTATVPSGIGAGDIIVTTEYGDAAPVPYTLKSPTIASFSPQKGVEGSKITITGQYLAAVTGVAIGGKPASFALLDQNTLEATVPVEGFGSISLSSAYGDIQSSAPFTATQSVIPSDSLALVAFYNATNGPNWTEKRNWLKGPVSSWQNVQVTNQRVTDIAIGSNINLQGALPEDMKNLTGLTRIIIGNNLIDEFPQWITQLTGLGVLSLYNNQMTGTVPADIGNLVNLYAFDIAANHLSGTLPESLGNLAGLFTLNLHTNEFTGAVPASLKNLPRVSGISLGYNYFSDLPDLSSMNSLRNFWLEKNLFTFEDLEPNVSIAGVVYAPQKELAGQTTQSVTEASPLEIIGPVVGGSANAYQWFKDGSPLDSATSTVLRIARTTAADAGNYVLKVTSPLVPNLTISAIAVSVTILPPADNDQDGYNALQDCNDNIAAVNPAAAESCDNIDNDCDGLVDEDCVTAPTIGPTELTFTHVSSTRMTISFKKGNGEGRIVFLKDIQNAEAPFQGVVAERKKSRSAEQVVAAAGAVVAATAVANEIAERAIPIAVAQLSGSYQANPDFLLAPLHEGYRVVMSGSDSSVTVNNLLPDTSYDLFVVEYNGSGSNTEYFKRGYLQGMQRTLPAVQPPSVQASSLAFSNVLSTQASLTFNKGNGQKRLVVLSSINDVTFVPEDDSVYLAGAVVNGHVVLSADTSSNIQVSNLQPATNYFVKVFEYNHLQEVVRYLKPGSASGTVVTPAQPNVWITSPANGAVNLNGALTLTARALSGATVYTIEVSESPSFSNVVVKTGSRSQRFDLDLGETYYTRVKTNLSPDYGRVTSFSTASPEYFAYITSPINLATAVNVNVNVTANPVHKATTYTIELNTASSFDGTSIVRSGARTLSFAGLQYNTTYYARVKTNLSDVWGIVRSFTTASPEQLAFVTSPGNLSVNQGVNLSVTANSVPGATLYTIELNPDITFSPATSLRITGGNRTAFFKDLLFLTTYYTRVKTDLTDAWGPVRAFTTGSAASLSYVTSPPSLATNVTWQPTVSANLIDRANLYVIQLSADGDFEDDPLNPNDLLEKSSVSHQIRFDLQPSTTYQARVKVLMNGIDQGWGEIVRTFTTGSASSLAFITAPANNATNVNIHTRVNSNLVPGATAYTIGLFLNPQDLSSQEWEITQSSSSMLFSGLMQNTKYFARAKTNVDPTTWGPASAFTTGTFQSLSFVTSPGNKATNVPWSTTVRVNALKDATSYTVQLHTDPGFDDSKGNSLVNTNSTGAFEISGLAHNTTYYSRVKTNLDSNWGETRRFTTGNPVSLSFITSPGNGASNVNFNTTIRANAVPEASVYTIKVVPVDERGRSVGAEITKSATSTSIPFLLPENQLFFAYVTTNLNDGIYGAVRSFTTGDLRSLSILSTPKNGGVGVPTNVNATASAIVGAANYVIEVNTSESFDGTSLVKSGTGTARTFNFSLTPNTIYYARVRHSLLPAGTWGQTTTFRTVNPAGREIVDWEGDEGEERTMMSNMIRVIQNPFQESLDLIVESDQDEPVQVELQSLTGISIYKKQHRTNELISISTPIANGVYVVGAQKGGQQQFVRVMKGD